MVDFFFFVKAMFCKFIHFFVRLSKISSSWVKSTVAQALTGVVVSVLSKVLFVLLEVFETSDIVHWKTDFDFRFSTPGKSFHHDFWNRFHPLVIYVFMFQNWI